MTNRKAPLNLQATAQLIRDNVNRVVVGKEAVIDLLLEAYWQGKSDLIAPVFAGRRGNPVLIGRDYFAELLALPPGDAPRSLLRRHAGKLHLVEVPTDAVLRDLDSPEQYERERPSG